MLFPALLAVLFSSTVSASTLAVLGRGRQPFSVGLPGNPVGSVPLQPVPAVLGSQVVAQPFGAVVAEPAVVVGRPQVFSHAVPAVGVGVAPVAPVRFPRPFFRRPFPPQRPLRPRCPAPPRQPRRSPSCKWMAVRDFNGCIIDYQCAKKPLPRPPPCPPAPEKPTEGDNCNWIAILNKHNCILEYECEPKPVEPCPDPPQAPDNNERCKWVAIKDHRGCVKQYECVPAIPAQQPPYRMPLPPLPARYPYYRPLPVVRPPLPALPPVAPAVSYVAPVAPAVSYVDQSQHCCYWASLGECRNNPMYMRGSCASSCGGSCGTNVPPPPPPPPQAFQFPAFPNSFRQQPLRTQGFNTFNSNWANLFGGFQKTRK